MPIEPIFPVPDTPNTVWVYLQPKDTVPPIVAVPDTLPVSGGYVVIDFVVKSEEGTFPASGAVILTTPSAQFPLVAWTDPDPALGLKVARLFDFNSDTTEYHYDVTVDRPPSNGNEAERLVVTVDPGIQNGR